jgi:hypothetical protein
VSHADFVCCAPFGATRDENESAQAPDFFLRQPVLCGRCSPHCFAPQLVDISSAPANCQQPCLTLFLTDTIAQSQECGPSFVRLIPRPDRRSDKSREMSMMRQPSHTSSMSSSTASPKPGRYSIFRKKNSISSSSSVPRDEQFSSDKVYEVCGLLSQ